MLSVATKVGRAFGGLKVRYKLMILHNLFFVVLSAGVYFSLMPAIGSWAEEARAREERLMEEIPSEARALLPSADQEYESIISRARLTIFVVLALTYWLGVLILELFVMPLYIYRPLRLLLEADEASQKGDLAHELIDESLILGDELGRLMRSRNATLEKLRRHEQELERALGRLENAKQSIADQDRLASLGLLSASVAHELNTPLAVMRGSVEKLLETHSDASTRERLERMLRVTQRLQKISESMVYFARDRSREMEPVPVRPVVDEAWSLVAIDEKASDVRFHVDVAREHHVRGNSDRLVQLFVNLLRNALHEVQSGGNITVQSTSLQEGGSALIAVKVEDDGPGISPDVLPDIFEAFVSARLDARGTGLGLAVAEGIVHQHGGTITARNRSEGGACLEVRLPVADERDGPWPPGVPGDEERRA